MTRTIHDLVSQAIQLRSAASPARANILDILATLENDDLAIISERGHLSDDRQREIAEQSGLTPRIVQGSLDKLIRLDMANDAGIIAKCKEYYLASGCSATKV